jgi:hypothetical protein
MDALGRQRNKRSPLVGCLVVTLVVVLFVVALVFGSDQYCRYEINQRLPFYPGATVLSSEYNGLRVRATGASQMSFSTPDDIETVREWFRQLNLERAKREGPQGLASVNYALEPNPEGEGTLIYYSTECGI